MKKRFINNVSSFITKYNDYSDLELKKINYGIEGLYLTLTKTIVILFLALMLNILKEVFIIIIIFNIIRYFGFGFHAEKSYQCLIYSLINFILLPLFFIKFKFSLNTYIVISLICIIDYFIFSPADTIKRPLPNRKKRLIRKGLTTFSGIICLLIIVYFNNVKISSILVCSMVIEAIAICPITYFIFGQPYNNYKKLNRA